jgi:O-antigen ligase
MDSPLEAIKQLVLLDIPFLAIAGFILFYFLLTKNIHGLFFIAALSSAFVGSTLPVISDIAALLRWVSIYILFLAGIILGKLKLSLGIVLIWGYAFLGFLYLFRAISINWQFQRSMLLIIVSVTIPFAYSSINYAGYKKSITLIAIAASIFNILNFIPLFDNLNNPVRYSGYAKGAPAVTLFMGGFLPFTFWGLTNQANSRIVKIISGFGLLFGIITLIFSGQRAGTISGLISLIPLLFTVIKSNIRSAIKIFSLLLVVVVMMFIFIQNSSIERLEFLLNRYNLESGFSNRDLIWRFAISQIEQSPIQGHGIGAVEVAYDFGFHNAYLEIWFNTGLFGVLLFLASQFYFLFRIIHQLLASNDPEIKSIYNLALGYMAGFIAICLVESKGAGASNTNMILYLFLGTMVTNISIHYPNKVELAEKNEQRKDVCYQ